ncbi:MAG: TIGR03668 family PPOX class F420-dependent oxidoreductase [Chloroflexi bacterium]|nr:TIGR03668 family PPOX class F420-dependent oxidoreductase [Chloroflexota bacterium]
MPYHKLEELPQTQIEALSDATVARLATADRSGIPHVVPVCFGVSNGCIFILLDHKPKRAKLTNLKRVKNILENSNVSLIIDYYDDDWTNLWYILISGHAALLEETPERPAVLDILVNKYPQYESIDLYSNPLIKIIPSNVLFWAYNDIGN